MNNPFSGFGFFNEEQHQGGNPMECPLCHGVRVIDERLNVEGAGDKGSDEWGCPNCEDFWNPRT